MESVAELAACNASIVKQTSADNTESFLVTGRLVAWSGHRLQRLIRQPRGQHRRGVSSYWIDSHLCPPKQRDLRGSVGGQSLGYGLELVQGGLEFLDDLGCDHLGSREAFGIF